MSKQTPKMTRGERATRLTAARVSLYMTYLQRFGTEPPCMYMHRNYRATKALLENARAIRST